MMVGLTNDERCLIHNLRVEKYWGSEKITKMFQINKHIYTVDNWQQMLKLFNQYKYLMFCSLYGIILT